MDIRLNLLDRARLLRDGVPVELEQRIMGVLIRLALDMGRNVTRDDLSRQVLHAAYGDPRLRHNHVYKCVSAIRAALDPERPGAASTVLRNDRGRDPAYRLELPVECVDLLQFESWVAAARSAPDLRAITLLTRALGLWQGRPLVDVADESWARERVEQLRRTHREARLRLLDLHEKFERFDQAIELATTALADSPADPQLRERLERLEALREQRQFEIHHPGPAGSIITVTRGDLFEQDDAHLVVGFSDTFETNTDDDFLVSSKSLQGQLLHRLYGGDRALLDGQLRKALAGVPRTVESRTPRQYGKRARYPLGTVATLVQGGRRIYAVAYAERGPDGLLAKSSMDLLRHSLDQLWLSVRRFGQHRPLAMGVLGSGLSRIYGYDRVDYVTAIVESFLRHCADGRLADELRIVIHPKDVAQTDFVAVDEAIAKLLS
ncbi:hypothetical protein Cs7R123_62530 [Catellatospora sp. TT07R-123]|uniref:macro domain-containing protein n=1 Tax=Catellatospora sp. TT07R-123 TaxID=2733863 RepID=UPI001B285825|nr:macro domain-containing protein [Catellatospora sp. TT07R-123]GHJ48911.1 hypothetical protein Cs7R123_62530 [Catellatospora sp. TT07R-123]